MDTVSRKLRILFVVVLSLFMLGAGGVRAGERAGVEWNTPPLEIYSDSLRQSSIDVAFNPTTASYLVAWITTQGTYTADLWARPVLLDGSMWPAFNIDSRAGEIMSWISIAVDTTRGRFLVVNSLDKNDGYELFTVRTVNWNGGSISTSYTYQTGVSSIYVAGPSAVYNPQLDRYLVVYEDSSDTSCSNNPKVVAQILNPETLDLETPSPVVIGDCSGSEFSFYGQTGYNMSTNLFQIIYSTSNDELIGRTLSADLSQLGSPIILASGNGFISEYDLASGAFGTNVAYMGLDGYSNIQVFGQLLSPEGNLLGSTMQISNEQTGMDTFTGPSTDFFGPLGYVTVWDFLPSPHPPDSFDAFYRIVPERPEQPQTSINILAEGPENQNTPMVSCAWGVQCLLIYLDNLSGDYDIFGRMIMMHKLHLPLVVR